MLYTELVRKRSQDPRTILFLRICQSFHCEQILTDTELFQLKFPPTCFPRRKDLTLIIMQASVPQETAMDGYGTSTLGLLSSVELKPKAQSLQKHLCVTVLLHFASENNKLCSPDVRRHFRSLKAKAYNMKYTPTRQTEHKQFKDTYASGQQLL